MGAANRILAESALPALDSAMHDHCWIRDKLMRLCGPLAVARLTPVISQKVIL